MFISALRVVSRSDHISLEIQVENQTLSFLISAVQIVLGPIFPYSQSRTEIELICTPEP